MKKLRSLFLLFALLLSADFVQAQCAMCTLNADNSTQNGQTQGKGLNRGILFLLACPYAAVCGVGLLWYTRYRKRNSNAQRA